MYNNNNNNNENNNKYKPNILRNGKCLKCLCFTCDCRPDNDNKNWSNWFDDKYDPNKYVDFQIMKELATKNDINDHDVYLQVYALEEYAIELKKQKKYEESAFYYLMATMKSGGDLHAWVMTLKNGNQIIDLLYEKNDDCITLLAEQLKIINTTSNYYEIEK